MNVPEAPRRTRCVMVIPCYGEEKRLRREAFSAFIALGHPVRFLFVNDGSKDGTLALLEEMRREHPGYISILDKPVNGGKGEAIRDGMLAAIAIGGEDIAFTGFWDADLATPLDAIPHLLQVLEAEPHLQMVFGSRVRLLGRTIQRKLMRHYAGRLFATAASLSLSIPIYDTQCGAKIFRVTPDLAAVLADTFLSKWVFDVEILARFVARRGRAFCCSAIYEFPLICWRDVDGSKLRGSDFLRSAGDLYRIHLAYLSGGRSRGA